MSQLRNIIVESIRKNGAMDVESFMNFCLAHPQFGYYMTRDPFGEAGDFTTAPEVSQLFGEMLGLWCVDLWQKMNSPISFHLVELGPGRGTLMRDLWRATKNVEGFHAAAQVHMVEMSPVLMIKQKQNLKDVPATWHESLHDIRFNAPVIFIANEFFDAIPVQQAIFHDNAWHMRRIDLNADNEFEFILGEELMSDFPTGQAGDVFEFSTIQDEIWTQICGIILRCGGGAVIIDYGDDVDNATDTLQAVKNNQFVDIFENVGEADLTTHVAFGRLKNIVTHYPIKTFGPLPQGQFLQNLPIQMRAQYLIKQNPNAAETITEGLERLIAPDQMGKLFKVMTVCHQDISDQPLGFL